MAYSSSAIQRYRELHTPKTGLNNKTAKSTITQSNIIHDTGAAIKEKPSTINISDVIGKGYKEIRSTTSLPSFWHSSRDSSETYLTRIRFCIEIKNKINSIWQPHTMIIILIISLHIIIKQFTDNSR